VIIARSPVRRYGGRMELVELDTFTEADWEQLIGGEQQPFGAAGAALSWGEKDRYLALRGRDGRIRAVAGAVRASVEVRGAGSFEVVGLGSLMVARGERGRGAMWKLVDPLLAIAREMGPERAMLFCRPELVALYERLGFAEIPDPVTVEQPGGRVEMPLAAMWLALLGDPTWPAGPVAVNGLPF
jgi:predicted N-acetyltransferase YhbS